MKRTELRRKKPWRWKPKPREDTRGCSSTAEQPPSKRTRAGSSPASSTTLKRSRPKMTPARRAAHGKPCLIRLPGCAGYVDGTEVLAHFRTVEFCGGGMKPPDWMGARGCSHCHDIVDGRSEPPEGYTYEEVRLAHLMGVVRTLAEYGMSDEILALLLKH